MQVSRVDILEPSWNPHVRLPSALSLILPSSLSSSCSTGRIHILIVFVLFLSFALSSNSRQNQQRNRHHHHHRHLVHQRFINFFEEPQNIFVFVDLVKVFVFLRKSTLKPVVVLQTVTFMQRLWLLINFTIQPQLCVFFFLNSCL